MKIYDCFLFSGEKKLLDLRINLYKKFVYKFIIIEGSVDFNGKKRKKIINKEFLRKNKNIRYINPDYDDFKSKDAWGRQRESRQLFLKGLYDAKDNDLIIISDIDEIISPSKFDFNHRGIVLYELAYNRFSINYQCLNLNWIEACTFPYKYLKTFSPQEMRLIYKTWKKRYDGDYKLNSRKFKILDSAKFVRYAGSHFSHFPHKKEDSFYKTIKYKLEKRAKDHYISRQSRFQVSHLYFKFLFFFGLDIYGLPNIWGKALKPLSHFTGKEQKLIKKYLQNRNIFSLLTVYNSKVIMLFARSIEYQVWKLTNFLVRVYARLLKIIIYIFLLFNKAKIIRKD